MAEKNAPRIHGIVLAGVYPGNPCALDDLTPRPLLPVAQQPLVTYALRWMMGGGLKRATICANTSSRAIRAHVDGVSLGMRVDYMEDWSPRGAAGCVRDAGLRTSADTFLVADGTSVPVVDVAELLDTHESSGAAITVVVGAESSGRLRPIGVYAFDRRALELIPAAGFQDIKERLIPQLYKDGDVVATYMARAVAPRVVSADTYFALNHWVMERASFHLNGAEGFRTTGETVLHATAEVDPSARLLGPVLIGPRVRVDAGATLVGPVTLGPGSTVARDAVVSRSVLWSACTVGEGAFIDRCMLTDGVDVEPRSTVFSKVRVARRRAGIGERAQGDAQGVWRPLLAALKPTTARHV
jgi:mannose-1-phosphate guanylyltransferase